IGTQRQAELLGQTIVVIGGTSGIGLETARRARAEGASVILTGRNPARLKQAALKLDTERTAAFDANPLWSDFLRHAVAATAPTPEGGGGNQQNSLVAPATYFAQPWPMFRCRCRYSDP